MSKNVWPQVKVEGDYYCMATCNHLAYSDSHQCCEALKFRVMLKSLSRPCPSSAMRDVTFGMLMASAPTLLSSPMASAQLLTSGDLVCIEVLRVAFRHLTLFWVRQSNDSHLRNRPFCASSRCVNKLCISSRVTGNNAHIKLIGAKNYHKISTLILRHIYP